MYRLYVNGIDNEHHYSELAREFFADGDYEVVPINIKAADNLALGDKSLIFNADLNSKRDGIKREMFLRLSELTGTKPEWGTLTGVKPLKPAMNIYIKEKSISMVSENLDNVYLISAGKRQLLEEILRYQIDCVSSPDADSWSLYTSIPFCPSICFYCSFGSEPAREESIKRYIPNLYKEIDACGEMFRNSDKSIESIYLGGGTPTSFNGYELSGLLHKIEDSFGIDINGIETTVEAGRPDTIDSERLSAVRNAGVNRISINPQSMRDDTLRKIGRFHSAADIEKAFALASQYEFEVINSDVIAGLPDETSADLTETIQRLIELGANNITVHTLSVKRGSKLRNADPEYYLRGVEEVESMINAAYDLLHKSGFVPYYIYRQKHQMGAFENTGWCLPGKHSLYNIRIMEEMQTVIGLGAGAIGKRYYPKENRLERIPNINDYRMYVERIDDIIARKRKYFD